MAVLITYDVSAEQSAIKEVLLKCGYQDRVPGPSENTIYYLPNTTLWHPTYDSQKALQDLESVTQALRVVLQRAIAAPGDKFWGIPGEPHK